MTALWYDTPRLPRLTLPLAGEPQAEEPEVPLYEGSADQLQKDLLLVSRNKLAERITGGLAQTTKMPCPSWNISATRCRIGSILAQQELTTCSDCYAMGGCYNFPSVQKKMEQRYQGLFDQLWTPSMIFLINYFCDKYFRWMDSGDVQGENHLLNIVRIAEALPHVAMWLPSREAYVIRTVRRRIGAFPENLIVRVSATMIDGPPPRGFPLTSTVVSNPEQATCPAPQNGNACGECRRCWDSETENVAYGLH